MSELDICTLANSKPPTNDKMKTVRMVVECTVGSLVEIFMTAVTKSVVGMVGGSKLAKLGVRAGGFLVGMWIGGQVSDHVCGTIEETMNMLEDVKKAIETGGSK